MQPREKLSLIIALPVLARRLRDVEPLRRSFSKSARASERTFACAQPMFASPLATGWHQPFLAAPSLQNAPAPGHRDWERQSPVSTRPDGEEIVLRAGGTPCSSAMPSDGLELLGTLRYQTRISVVTRAPAAQ